VTGRDPSAREWEEWQHVWRSAGPPAPQPTAGLVQRVRSRGRRMLLGFVAESLLAVGLLAYALQTAVRRPDPPTLVWAAAVWLFVLVAWGWSLRSRRGLWRPLGQHPRAYLRLEQQRQRLRLRMVRFARALVASELLFVAAWYAWRLYAHPQSLPRGPGRYVLQGVLIGSFTLGVVAWTVWCRRRALRELAVLDQIARSLED
jgi:hypothetical protein